MKNKYFAKDNVKIVTKIKNETEKTILVFCFCLVCSTFSCWLVGCFNNWMRLIRWAIDGWLYDFSWFLLSFLYLNIRLPVTACMYSVFIMMLFFVCLLKKKNFLSKSNAYNHIVSLEISTCICLLGVSMLSV